MPPYKTNILPSDQTLLTLSDLGIKTASATEFEVENGSTSLVLNSTDITVTATDLEIDEIDAQGDFDIANIEGADLELGTGVLKYNPSTNLIQYSTSDTGAVSGIIFSFTLVHSGFSGINSVSLQSYGFGTQDLLNPNPTTFNPRIEDRSESFGNIQSHSTTIGVIANPNSGSASYSWSGSSTITFQSITNGYRVFTGFTNGSYTLTVTVTDDD